MSVVGGGGGGRPPPPAAAAAAPLALASSCSEDVDFPLQLPSPAIFFSALSSLISGEGEGLEKEEEEFYFFLR